MTSPTAQPSSPSERDARPSATPSVDAAARPALSITDFITDASLPAACDHLMKLVGVEVSLRDPEGRKIVRRAPPPAWEFDLSAPPVGPESVSIPLLVEGRAIGSIVVGPGSPMLSETEGRARLLEAMVQIAKTASDFCRQDVDLRHRVKEVQALYRLSSMLVRATKAEAVLDIALESALDALELDAGSIVLFEQDEGPTTHTEVDLVLKASRGLSREWLESPLPLSKERLFDRLALEGQVVVSQDLRSDDRVLIHDHVMREGLRAAMHAGLVFQDRAIGVIRLYARRPRDFAESEKRLLKSIAAQAAVAVEQARLLKMQEREQRVQRQVQLAVDVQRRMLPRKVPTIPKLDVAARYLPSFELGGDFYDFFELAGSFGITIGDVVGKGLAAALLMASVRASLRAHVQDIYHIDDVLSRVNVALARDTLDNEFATLWYGVLDIEKLRLTYCAGGHEPPMVFRAVQGRAATLADIDELSIGGMAVGIDPSQRYQRGTYDLHSRDVMVAYTDGVTDTLNFSGKKFGKQRLRQSVLKLLADEPEATAARITDHIYWELRQFAGILERPDDQTVVVVRVK